MTVNMSINADLLEKLQHIAVLQNITADALAERILSEYIEYMMDYQDAVNAYEEYTQNPVSLSNDEVCKEYGVK